MSSNHPRPVDEVSDSLGELIEEHIKRITERLDRDHSLTDIADSVARLNDLLSTYKQRAELFDHLADLSTPEREKKQIRAALRAQRVTVTMNRIDFLRLVARSHDLIERSAHLITTIQRRVDQEAHKHSGYQLEECGFCEGVGGTTLHPCPACKGKGTVLVHQPAIQCARCNGSGKPEAHTSYLSNLCEVCRGFGWVMTADHG